MFTSSPTMASMSTAHCPSHSHLSLCSWMLCISRLTVPEASVHSKGSPGRKGWRHLVY